MKKNFKSEFFRQCTIWKQIPRSLIICLWVYWSCFCFFPKIALKIKIIKLTNVGGILTLYVPFSVLCVLFFQQRNHLQQIMRCSEYITFLKFYIRKLTKCEKSTKYASHKSILLYCSSMVDSRLNFANLTFILLW